MSDFKVLTNHHLLELIADTEETLDALKYELDRREQRAQQQEIANLENHMQSAELSLKSIREFVRYLAKSHRDS